MERNVRLSKAAVVIVAVALVAAIAAAVWFAHPDAPYVPSADSGAALGTAAPAEDGTATDDQPSGTGISDNGTPNSAITTIRSSLASNKSYYLTDDITVTSFHTSTEWTDEYTFGNATLDGAGHTITIDAKSTGSNADVGGLFMGLRDGAVIKNLTIKVTGFSFGVSGDTLNAGIIAGYASGTNITIQNVKVILDYDTSNSSNSNQDNYAYNTNQADAITIRLGGLVGKVEKGTTTVKNVTVHNSAGGTYGFSAQSWTTNPGWPSNSTSQLSVGGFVGDVMDNGDLDAYQITYSTDGTGKISAVGESSSGNRENQGLVGGVVGYLSNGSVDISGLVIDVPGAIGTLFTGHNMNTTYSGGFVVGHKNDAPTLSMSGIIVNDKSEIGNGAVDEDEYLVGNDGIWSGRVTYPSDVVEAVRFSSDGTPMFAIAKKAPTDATGIVAEIYQHQISIADPAESVDITNWTESGLTSQFVAQDESEVGQLVWITLPQLTTTGSNDYELLVNYSTSSTYSVVTDGTIESVDGTTYKGSKEYDGTAYATPYITIGSEQINAWTADNTTADVGIKKFTYLGDSALTGYQVVSYANGDKYLVKGGTVYSPSTITIGGQSGQAFKLGNSFSYEITPAPVTVTPSVPDDDLYTGNSMPEITATAVDSGGSPVEGSIAWDNPDATLISGNNSYNWTWTPTSSNYQTVTGSIKLEAFDKAIERLTIDGEFKTAYVAFEPFDPTGVKVTAHYTDGSSAQLGNDEYQFTVVNGDINKLIVANDTVTVSLKKGSGASATITITVNKLAVDVPTAIQGLEYNGSEQTGVEVSAENYCSLTGNTGTDADIYTATATLPDTANTRWNTADADDIADKSIAWSIAKKDVDITVGHTSKTYDGQEVVPSTLFTPPEGVDGQPLDLDIVVADNKTILNADTYSVTARLASTETNYAAEEVEIDYTIETIKVSGNIVFTSDNIYDGTAKTAVFTLDDPSALIGSDQVTITYLEEDRTNVTGEEITAIAVLPSHNYDWADGTSMATLTIVPKKVEIESIQEITKTYDGNTVDPKTLFIAPNGVDGQPIELTVTVDGGKTILNADTYTVTASIAESVTHYTAEDKTITYTIDKKGIEKPIDSVNPYTYNGTEQGFDIAGNADYTVTGTTEATNADDYTFTIALTDKINTEWTDNTSEDIVVEWSIMKMTIAGAVSAPADLSYDGNAKIATFTKTSGELFGEDEITISYNDGADTVNVTKQTITATASLPNDNYTWSEDSVFSASYEIKPMIVTIGRVHEDVYVDKYYDGEEVDPKTLFTAPNGADGQPLELEFTVDKQAIDGDKTILGVGTYNVTAKLAAGQDNYTADAIEVVYQIYKKNVEIPYDDNATTFKYTGTEQGFTIEESDYYTVTGVTNATDAGEYSFTIALTDKDNTDWANGANDDITVSWSITKATFKEVIPQFEEGALDGLFTSDPLPMPTQVITDPAGVDGTFTWQDQQLIAGTKVYIWRFTAPNYEIYSGETSITVSQAQLDHIEVSEAKTEYTAYDAFDKEGMIVTAYYNHGGDTLDPVQLTSGYTISVKDGGNIDKLSVKDVAVIVKYTDGEVTDTAEIAITVSKLAVDIPTANQGLVYDGNSQIGIDKSPYYMLSGDPVGTNADTYTATAMLIDTDNTEWKSGSTDNITITWSIAPMTVSGEIVADDLVYDGTEKGATFNGQLIGEDKVEIEYAGDRVNVTEDGFTVTAILPSDGCQNYRFENGGQELTKTFKVEPKQIFLGQGNYTWGWIYGDSPVVADLGGNTNNETSFVRAYEDDGLTTPFVQGVDFAAEEKDNDLAQLVNAGEYTLVFTLVKGNYWAEPYEVTVSVAKKAVSAAAVTITAPDTIYTGEEKNAEASVSVALVGNDEITIEYNNVDRVNVTGEKIIATAKLTDNYEWRSDDGIPQEAPFVTYTIQKADVIVDTSSISDVEWSTASDMPELIAEDSQGNAVPGEFVWTPDKLSADIQDYAWVFTPDDGNNYNGTSGNVTLNVAQAILESITVEIVTETEYESNDAFDRNDIVVTAIYDGGYAKIVDKEDYVLKFSSGFEDELQTGVITVTVSYTDGETKSATFEIVVAQKVTADQVKAAINAMDKVTWQNASEYLDLKKRYNALDDADKDVETSAKLTALQTQYDALRDAAIDDIEGAHEVAAKAVGRALAVAAGLAAAAVAAAIAKRRFI